MKVNEQMNTERLIKKITDFYVSSGDYNGLPVHSLNLDRGLLKDLLIKLLNKNLIDINFGDYHPNPHIKTFQFEPRDKQIQKINLNKIDSYCLYPSKEHLAKIIKKEDYITRPYDLMLMLGSGQLEYIFCDLSVLENYRNDPRYSYDIDGVQGSISVLSEHYENGSLQKKDEIYIQTFGFGYTKDLSKRCIAIHLRYLVDLSPEHQQLWKMKELGDIFFPHPDYHDASMGRWPKKGPILSAFFEEIQIINKMAKKMDRPTFFKNDFQVSSDKPRNFEFLLRPTSKEYYDFVSTLDKMISENINMDFFQKEIDYNFKDILLNGKISNKPKGSITILDEWLDKTINFYNKNPKDEMIAKFKKVRKLRQKPAHKLDDNKYDYEYIKKQRELINEAYDAVRTLRLIFANHPKAKLVEIPDWIYKGDIRTY